MSMPTIPKIAPEINIDREDTINLLLASIAFEELALAHIINAEAEKIQNGLGTMKGQRVKDRKLEDVIRINKSVNSTLKSSILNQMLLDFKMRDCIELIEEYEDDDEG